MKRKQMIINKIVSRIYDVATNEKCKNEWILNQLNQIPNGYKILDAGAGQLR